MTRGQGCVREAETTAGSPFRFSQWKALMGERKAARKGGRIPSWVLLLQIPLPQWSFLQSFQNQPQPQAPHEAQISIPQGISSKPLGSGNPTCSLLCFQP